MEDARALTEVAPAELLGYDDPSSQPEATGVDKLVLKRGNLFLVANRLGDVAPAGARDLGLFLGDTRHLSGWRLSLAGGPPLCLSSQVSADYVAQIDFTVTSLHEGGLLGAEPVNSVHLRRDMLIDDVLVDRLVLTNFQGRPVDTWIAVSWAADFADVFEIRGAHRAARGTYEAPRVSRRAPRTSKTSAKSAAQASSSQKSMRRPRTFVSESRSRSTSSTSMSRRRWTKFTGSLPRRSPTWRLVTVKSICAM